MIELFTDPTVWVGLLTLVVLEIVLGIDNLVFIAILASRLPPRQRDMARIIGLSLALFMRLALLAAISWLVGLTAPLFHVGPMAVSGRDLILFLGGLFLLYKATTELHARLEGEDHHAGTDTRAYPSLWVVIAQIVALDAVFSLDSVITAVGMVNDLPVMMAAVVIAIIVMLVASKPLTNFVNAHPTVVVLCLSFLLMIGLSLVADGLGFHLPKGYLYAAIGFSIMIEVFNQIAQRNRLKKERRLPARQRAAEAILRLLAGPQALEAAPAVAGDAPAMAPGEAAPFVPEERQMVQGVLTLAERSLRSVMTPRSHLAWINIEDDADAIRAQLRSRPHSRYPIARGTLDRLLGIVRAKDAIYDLAHEGAIREDSIRKPMILSENMQALHAIHHLRQAGTQLALVSDEHGVIQGCVTPLDVLEAIAGDFPEEGERPEIQPQGDGRWLIDGGADLHHLEQVLETRGLVSEDERYTTIAGLMNARLQRTPTVGDSFRHENYEFRVTDVRHQRAHAVEVTRIDEPGEEEMAQHAGA
ncbi:MAG TPA: TerC family protein [Burkholderiales bacterium]|nr:TerC family protein [Burkholderiales bacterium]